MRYIIPLFILSLILGSCSQRLVYHQYSDYTYNEDKQDCIPTHHTHKSKLKVNTKAGYVKAYIFGKEKKLQIKNYEYQYNFLSLFHKKKDRKSIRIECYGDYSVYIEYGRFAILSIPDDEDEDECDDTIFYDLK